MHFVWLELTHSHTHAGARMNTFWGRYCSREAVGSAIKRLTSKMLPDFNCLREREGVRRAATRRGYAAYAQCDIDYVLPQGLFGSTAGECVCVRVFVCAEALK